MTQPEGKVSMTLAGHPNRAKAFEIVLSGWFSRTVFAACNSTFGERGGCNWGG